MELTVLNQAGVQVPELASPLSFEELEGLKELFNPTAPSLSFGADIYSAVVQYVESILELRQES